MRDPEVKLSRFLQNQIITITSRERDLSAKTSHREMLSMFYHALATGKPSNDYSVQLALSLGGINGAKIK